MIGNLNTPISVTYSAVIYCLRAMVDLDVRIPAITHKLLESVRAS